MILEDVLFTLKERVLHSGFISEFYEYCELIKRDEAIYPAYYIGSGQYDPVYDFDVSGAGYVRKRSEVSIAYNTQLNELTSCSDDNQILDMSYPLRAVFGVPRKLLGDDAYSDDRLFSEMVVLFSGSYTSTDASEIATKIRSFNTDSLTIWTSEVKGVDYQMLFELAYIAIDFDIVFTVNKDCLAQVCGYGY